VIVGQSEIHHLEVIVSNVLSPHAI
jgi:hypothetical protein